ncbi:hypothetical protein FB451DRAFT_1368550 [Mycena latifolia]|nr:hypothetical protein FB451DRAFT_1368550 [Mycena latifolia]
MDDIGPGPGPCNVEDCQRWLHGNYAALGEHIGSKLSLSWRWSRDGGGRHMDAGKLFKAGDFSGAAKYYELATTTTDRVSVYFSNLVAAYRGARAAADKALQLEPRALKARYRRAIARKSLNLLPEALVDIFSSLASDPRNAEGKDELQILLNMQKEDGKKAQCDYAPSTTNVATLHGAYHTYRTPKHRKDLNTCKKCYRVNYCSVKCQRAECTSVSRPDHKLTCKPAPDGNTTIRVGRRIADYAYFCTHLLLYAIRAIDPPKLPGEDHDFILMVVVDMVPLLGSPRPGRKSKILSRCPRASFPRKLNTFNAQPSVTREMLNHSPVTRSGSLPVESIPRARRAGSA